VRSLRRTTGRSQGRSRRRAQAARRTHAVAATNIIHDNLDFDVFRGEIIGLVGGSGSGKSVLLRAIIGLNDTTAGTIEHPSERISASCMARPSATSRGRTGVQFQDGALFSSLSGVGEHHCADPRACRAGRTDHGDIAALKVALVGCRPTPATRSRPSCPAACASAPSRARGAGSRSRVAVPGRSRPPALDPIAGRPNYDELVKGLNHSLGLTILMVTHDLDSLYAACDRIAVLLDKHVVVGYDGRDAGIRSSLGSGNISTGRAGGQQPTRSRSGVRWKENRLMCWSARR